MTERVEITETVRDAWQGLPRVLPTADKVAFIRRLLAAGFPRIDVGSFVSPRRVPAMADTGEVLEQLHAAGAPAPAAPGATPATRAPRLTALVASESGLERLLQAPGVGEVLYPFSLSERFQRRNTERGREDAFTLLQSLTTRAHAAGRTVYATISMAFGNNEGDRFDPAELREWVARLHDAGVDRTGLADTTAMADARAVADVFAVVMRRADWAVPAAHLHVTPQNQAALVDAALGAGCRNFDAALGALGGCQFAKGAESNISTLPLVEHLRARGFDPGLELAALPALDAAARALARG